MKLRTLPTRAVTDAYILHSARRDREVGRQSGGGRRHSWHGLGRVPGIEVDRRAQVLARALWGEIAIGMVLLAPFVPAGLAGAALTGFSGGLVAMYLRTPSLRKPGSVWPSPQATAISKDVWMLGIGLGLLIDEAVERRRSSKT